MWNTCQIVRRDYRLGKLVSDPEHAMPVQSVRWHIQDNVESTHEFASGSFEQWVFI